MNVTSFVSDSTVSRLDRLCVETADGSGDVSVILDPCASLLYGKIICLFVFGLWSVGNAFFSPDVLCLEVCADSDASRLSEVTLDLESSITSGHQLWIVLHNDYVREQLAVLKSLALTEREFHCERSSTSAFHVARCFLFIETSSRVNNSSKSFFRQQLDLHWVSATFELNFLQAFSRCIDVERVWEILFPHICWRFKHALSFSHSSSSRLQGDEII